jgi:hypothetical protein
MWGGASPPDIDKVKSHLGGSAVENVFKNQIQKLLEEAKGEARFSNQSVQKFNSLLLKQTRAISENFMQKDVNQDGALNIDGFKSAILGAIELQDHKITLPQLNEIFNLISDNKEFHYIEYVCNEVD